MTRRAFGKRNEEIESWFQTRRMSDATIELIAHVCHEAIRAYRYHADTGPSWEDATEQWRQDLTDQVFRTIEYPDSEAADMFEPVGDFHEHGLMQAIALELWENAPAMRDEQLELDCAVPAAELEGVPA